MCCGLWRTVIKAYAADRNIDDANYLSTVCNVKLKSGSDVLSIMMTEMLLLKQKNNIIKYSKVQMCLKSAITVPNIHPERSI